MTDATDLLRGFDERFHGRRGTRLRYFAGGEGPPLLLVHGYGGAAWNWAELAPLLPGRRLLIPDLPGHGGSTALPATPTLAGFADVLARLCEEEGLATVDVVGHSLGGVVGLRLAERRPQLVRRLVLAAAAGISSSSRLSEVFVTLAGVGIARMAYGDVSSARRTLLVRAALLLGLGALNLRFDWYIDILHFYACYLAIAAIFFLRATPRALLGLSLIHI